MSPFIGIGIFVLVWILVIWSLYYGKTRQTKSTEDILSLRGNTFTPLWAPPLWTTTEISIANGGTGKPEDLPLVVRLNQRYGFADVKINNKVSIMTWKNFAGKKMQSSIDLISDGAWKRACMSIEDSLHDTKTMKPTKKKPRRANK